MLEIFLITFLISQLVLGAIAIAFVLATGVLNKTLDRRIKRGIEEHTLSSDYLRLLE